MTGATSRVALVTGASSGIGAATAHLLAVRGMRVVVNYLRGGTAAEEIVAGIEAAGGQAMAVQADVRESAAVENMIEQVQAAWGGIDVLVHNALIPYVIKPFQDMTWEELGGKLDDEMFAAFAVTKAVLPAMTEQGWGRIIYLGAGPSRRPREGMIALGTAKAALASAFGGSWLLRGTKAVAQQIRGTPGAANGRTWLGQTKPQLPCEQPLPNSPRSRTVTDQPARDR